jgi:hypothetical protein
MESEWLPVAIDELVAMVNVVEPEELSVVELKLALAFDGTLPTLKVIVPAEPLNAEAVAV